MTGPNRVSKSKAKGTAWERRLVEHFKTRGFPWAERRALEGTNDRGDIAGLPGVVIEAKNAKRVELAGWVDEMIVEKRNARATIGAVIFPRRSHATGRAFVVMELDQFIDLLGDDLILGRVKVPSVAAQNLYEDGRMAADE